MSGFELSRRFIGEPIDCNVMVWHARFENKKDKDQEDHRRMTIAPHSTTFLGFGFGGEWKSKPFYLDPKQCAIRIGTQWVRISDIDAASQFTVEREHAVAFPHESKQIYVSGHVGLHIHAESTDEAYTMAFPGFELADVAFDAVNKLSYDQLSAEIFQEDHSDDEESGSSSAQQSGTFQQKPAALMPRPKKPKQQQQQQTTKGANHNDDDDDDNFVATSGTQLLERGKGVDINDFTTFFLEGGGMGAISDQASKASSGLAGGAPNGGVLRLRKDTGSLSTWIARLEPGETSTLYMMKLSKAAIKAPLNKIIQRSAPSVARHFGPVVPLAFENLTIRSESMHAQFVLEEVYVANTTGDTRIHRLICVFNSLDERLRWEEWLQKFGVKKRAIESAAMSKKVQDGGEGGVAAAGEAADDQSNGTKDGDKKGDGAVKMDPTMKLVFECFDLEEKEEWAKARLLRGDDDEFEDIEDDGEEYPFVGDTPRDMNNNSMAMTSNASFAGGPRSPLKLSEARLRSPSYAPLSSSASPALGSPASSMGRASSPLSPGRRKKVPRASPESIAAAAALEASKKTPEQELVEMEAVERCRWFAGYTPAKENKWAALSSALKQERSAGSSIFTAVAKLKGQQKSSGTFSAAASAAQFDDDAGRAHLPRSPESSGSKSPTTKGKLQALIRAGQISRALDAIQRAKDAPQSEAANAETARAISALNELDAVEQDAMMAEIKKREVDAADQAKQQQQQQEAASASSLIDSSPSAQFRTTATGADAVTQMQNFAAAAILQQEASLSPTERQAQRLKRMQGATKGAGDDEESKDQRHGAANLSLPGELSTHLEAQRRIGQQSRVLGELPSDGSMFGRPVLYGDSMRPKFEHLNLRSEGYVDPESVQSAVRKNAPPTEGRDDGGGSSAPTGAAAAAAAASAGSSPVADAARDFAFDFHSPAQSSIGRDRAAGGGATGDEGWSSALYDGTPSRQQQQQQQQHSAQRRLVETSSDSDDESSRRFANARALRAVSQLGEEFVGPSNPRKNMGVSSSSSSLNGHLNPTCPLCGADRSSVAICKKTGRLHASLMPRYADTTSSSRVYR